jgi:hypothetical protein
MTRPSEEKPPPDGLHPSEGQTARDISLEDAGIPDLQEGVPEQGWSEDPEFHPIPGRRPTAVLGSGLTAYEQSAGDSLTERLDRELPDEWPDVRPAADPNRPTLQLHQDENTSPGTDSGTGRTADDIEASAETTVGGEMEEEAAVHVRDA